MLMPMLRQLWRFALRVHRAFIDAGGLQLAAMLTYTTLLAIVPLFAVALTVFTAFPAFEGFIRGMNDFYTSTMLPESVSKVIAGYIDQFTHQAARLTAVGLAVLTVTAIALMFTIERAFNRIWHVRRPRPVVTRTLVYWSVLTLGPVFVGVSLSVTSYLIGISLGYASQMPGAEAAVLGLAPVVLMAIAFTLLYYVVPNRAVLFRHAMVGGILAAVLFDFAKRAFVGYLAHFPSYTLVYGAFAVAPIFLVWVYLSWVVTLLGAALAAQLPDWHSFAARTFATPGRKFTDALSLLRELVKLQSAARTARATELSRIAGLPYARTENLMESMAAAGWVARTAASDWVLSCDPDRVTLADVYRHFVFAPPAGVPGGELELLLEVARSVDRAAAEALNQPISRLVPG